MDWEGLVYGPLKIILGLGLVYLAVMGFVNLVVPDTIMTVSLGYSMCKLRSPYFDFLTLKNTTCSVTPGDSLIVVYKQPEINDVVCAATKIGVICHRLVYMDENGFCFVGDNANWKGCYPWKSYVGEAVGKFPRNVAMPGVILWALGHGYFNAYELINEGSYALAER